MILESSKWRTHRRNEKKNHSFSVGLQFLKKPKKPKTNCFPESARTNWHFDSNKLANADRLNVSDTYVHEV